MYVGLRLREAPLFFLILQDVAPIEVIFCFVRSQRGSIVPSRTVFIFEAPPPLFANEVGSWCDTQLHARNMFDCEAPPPSCVLGGVGRAMLVGALGAMFRRVFVGDLWHFWPLR